VLTPARRSTERVAGVKLFGILVLGVAAHVSAAVAVAADARGPVGAAAHDPEIHPRRASSTGEVEAAGRPASRERREALAELQALEERLRARARFEQPTPWRDVSGADPFALRELPGTDRLVGILRGDSAVVLLDADGRELERHRAPAHPTGLEVSAAGQVLVSGEASREVARFAFVGDTLAPLAAIDVAGVLALRDVALVADRVYALDPARGKLVSFANAGGRRTATDVAECRGGLAIDAVGDGDGVLTNCLLEHAIVLRDATGRELARVRHDGPFWSMAAVRDREGTLLLAAGGVEDAPLDRSAGFFGSVDSFVYLYRIGERGSERLASVDVSDLGLVTPKWVALAVAEGGGARVEVAGYGSDRRLELAWSDPDAAGRPEVAARRFPPGTTASAGRVAANPLLDAWVVSEPGGVRMRVLPAGRSRSAEARIGELLFFTTLMAPWSSSEGTRSRFTCETCHHEGGVDGRTHWTGRGEVHATTKPLFGLLANRPFFSRALDPTMARMVDNEFRVANRGSGHSSWFAVERRSHPWLAAIDGLPDVISPERLRASLVAFLAQHEPAPNPATLGRRRFAALERAGASEFRERCEGCHAARLVADEPASRVPFPEWEQRIFGGGPILWGREGYERTGVEPYVHAAGARVPALRRLGAKSPYFTNGSAATLEEVLTSATWSAGGFRHAGGSTAPSTETLTGEERRALLAFLALL
jgi:hypothetical protein